MVKKCVFSILTLIWVFLDIFGICFDLPGYLVLSSGFCFYSSRVFQSICCSSRVFLGIFLCFVLSLGVFPGHFFCSPRISWETLGRPPQNGPGLSHLRMANCVCVFFFLFLCLQLYLPFIATGPRRAPRKTYFPPRVRASSSAEGVPMKGNVNVGVHVHVKLQLHAQVHAHGHGHEHVPLHVHATANMNVG